jgi:hypothetical protein
MEIPLKLKWLGKETGELCNLIAPFHPLILISPVPYLQSSEVPPGLLQLPRKIFQVWDLRNQENGSTDDLALESLDMNYDSKNFAALYEFYFEVYLKNVALGEVWGTTEYHSIETFHRALLEQQFVALLHLHRDSQPVASLLLRNASTVELNACRDALAGSVSIQQTDIAVIDVVCNRTQRHGASTTHSIARRAAGWAKDAGYSFLAFPANSLHTGASENDADWSVADFEMLTVSQPGTSALLYCDLSRCSYFSKDVYYYSLDEQRLSLNYVANVQPTRSRIGWLLNSKQVEKKIYTRHGNVRAALSDAGINCEFLRRENVSN